MVVKLSSLLLKAKLTFGDVFQTLAATTPAVHDMAAAGTEKGTSSVVLNCDPSGLTDSAPTSGSLLNSIVTCFSISRAAIFASATGHYRRAFI